jgi:uncharacterized membrane protein
MMESNRFITVLLLACSAIGLAVSAYLTSVHYSDVPLVCNADAVVNCEQVLTSSYAELMGSPWSVGGLVWFGITGAMASVSLLRRPEPAWLQPAQVGWSVVGLMTAVYLVGVEVLAVDKVCLWCTGLHILILLIFILHVVREPDVADEDGGSDAPEADFAPDIKTPKRQHGPSGAGGGSRSTR